ncbi:UNVERIFIED_CONTAM: hypothetical protein O8I53_10655, partial [Campylobacter lari]
ILTVKINSLLRVKSQVNELIEKTKELYPEINAKLVEFNNEIDSELNKTTTIKTIENKQNITFKINSSSQFQDAILETERLINKFNNIIPERIEASSLRVFSTAYQKLFTNAVKNIVENNESKTINYDKPYLDLLLDNQNFSAEFNREKINQLRERYKQKYEDVYFDKEVLIQTFIPILNEIGNELAKPLEKYLNEELSTLTSSISLSSSVYDRYSKKNSNSELRQNVQLFIKENGI